MGILICDVSWACMSNQDDVQSRARIDHKWGVTGKSKKATQDACKVASNLLTKMALAHHHS